MRHCGNAKAFQAFFGPPLRKPIFMTGLTCLHLVKLAKTCHRFPSHSKNHTFWAMINIHTLAFWLIKRGLRRRNMLGKSFKTIFSLCHFWCILLIDKKQEIKSLIHLLLMAYHFVVEEGDKTVWDECIIQMLQNIFQNKAKYEYFSMEYMSTNGLLNHT